MRGGRRERRGLSRGAGGVPQGDVAAGTVSGGGRREDVTPPGRGDSEEGTRGCGGGGRDTQLKSRPPEHCRSLSITEPADPRPLSLSSVPKVPVSPQGGSPAPPDTYRPQPPPRGGLFLF